MKLTWPHCNYIYNIRNINFYNYKKMAIPPGKNVHIRIMIINLIKIKFQLHNGMLYKRVIAYIRPTRKNQNL